MKIGNVEIQGNIFLAPLAGVTDFAFRSIAKEYGASLTCTEMVSAKGLVLSKNRDVYNKMLFTEENETPKVVQLFGSEEEYFVKAIKHPDLEKFDIIDINMGCPAPKIVKNCEGSALLKEPEKALKIVKACVEATNKPITVKMRSGYYANQKIAVEFAKELEKVGVKAITIHGRTKEDMFSGQVDYEIIKAVKDAVKIPVVANGDIVDKPSLEKMKQTGADAFMIGRGAIGAPWIFKELKTGKEISKKEKYNSILKHLELLQKIFSETYIKAYFRKHLLWYVKGMPNANEYRIKLATISSIQEAKDILKKIFD